MFVAFFGLTFRETSFNNVSVFSADIIEKYQLNIEEIKKIIEFSKGNGHW